MSEEANRALLRRKFGRPVPADPHAKVTLSIAGLCKILEAARMEERTVTKDRREANVESVVDRAMGILKERGL